MERKIVIVTAIKTVTVIVPLVDQEIICQVVEAVPIGQVIFCTLSAQRVDVLCCGLTFHIRKHPVPNPIFVYLSHHCD